ncbi:hypothetical protein Hanom_Chr00s000001g01594611 [Helianthus anomalus]
MFSSDGFPGLKKAILFLQSTDASIAISLLQQLYHVKYLSLSMEIIECLNSSVELISHQPFPLANLKSLKILPKIYVRPEDKHKKVVVSTKVKKTIC